MPQFICPLNVFVQQNWYVIINILWSNYKNYSQTSKWALLHTYIFSHSCSFILSHSLNSFTHRHTHFMCTLPAIHVRCVGCNRWGISRQYYVDAIILELAASQPHPTGWVNPHPTGGVQSPPRGPGHNSSPVHRPICTLFTYLHTWQSILYKWFLTKS